MPECLEDFELVEHLQTSAHFDSYRARLKNSPVPIEAIVKVVKKKYMKTFRKQVRKDQKMQLGEHRNLNYSKWVGPDKQGRIWKARQFFRGGPVMRLQGLDDGKLKEAYIAYILHETLKALTHLHKNKFTHTSVKPSNIILTEFFDVKLTDPWVRAPMKHKKSRKGRSQTMVEFHNPLWTPPEGFKGNSVEQKGDIWSLGLCAIQLATGSVPDSGKPVWKIAWARVMSAPPQLMDTENHKWSEDFKDFVQKCLIKNPKLRPSAAELIRHKFLDTSNWSKIAGVGPPTAQEEKEMELMSKRHSSEKLEICRIIQEKELTKRGLGDEKKMEAATAVALGSPGGNGVEDDDEDEGCATDTSQGKRIPAGRLKFLQSWEPPVNYDEASDMRASLDEEPEFGFFRNDKKAELGAVPKSLDATTLANTNKTETGGPTIRLDSMLAPERHKAASKDHPFERDPSEDALAIPSLPPNYLTSSSDTHDKDPPLFPVPVPTSAATVPRDSENTGKELKLIAETSEGNHSDAVSDTAVGRAPSEVVFPKTSSVAKKPAWKKKLKPFINTGLEMEGNELSNPNAKSVAATAGSFVRSSKDEGDRNSPKTSKNDLDLPPDDTTSKQGSDANNKAPQQQSEVKSKWFRKKAMKLELDEESPRTPRVSENPLTISTDSPRRKNGKPKFDRLLNGGNGNTMALQQPPQKSFLARMTSVDTNASVLNTDTEPLGRPTRGRFRPKPKFAKKPVAIEVPESPSVEVIDGKIQVRTPKEKSHTRKNSNSRSRNSTGHSPKRRAGMRMPGLMRGRSYALVQPPGEDSSSFVTNRFQIGFDGVRVISDALRPLAKHPSKNDDGKRGALVGERFELGDMVAIRHLGQGASGYVSQEMYIPWLKLVACKYLRVDNQRLRHQIDKELTAFIKTQQGLHAGIVNLIGGYYREGYIVIVLEYMNMGSLRDSVKTYGVLPELCCAEVAKQLLVGLNYLHTKGILHRDIKPDNFLASSDGQVKLADFGLAQQTDENGYCKTKLGTVMYLAPELLQEKDSSYPADVWAFGLSLYYLAEGRHPMPGDFWALLEHITTEPPPMLGDRFSPDFRDFVSRCLVRDPSKRSGVKELLQHPFIKKAPGREYLGKHFCSLKARTAHHEAQSVLRSLVKKLFKSPNSKQFNKIESIVNLALSGHNGSALRPQSSMTVGGIVASPQSLQVGGQERLGLKGPAGPITAGEETEGEDILVDTKEVLRLPSGNGEREAMVHLSELAEQLCLAPGDVTDILTEIYLSEKNGYNLGDETDGTGRMGFRQTSCEDNTDTVITTSAFPILLDGNGIDEDTDTPDNKRNPPPLQGISPPRITEKSNLKLEKQSPNADDEEDDGMHTPAAGGAATNEFANLNEKDENEEERTLRSKKKSHSRHRAKLSRRKLSRRERKNSRTKRELMKSREEKEEDMALGCGCGPGEFFGCGIIFRRSKSTRQRDINFDDRPERIPASVRSEMRRKKFTQDHNHEPLAEEEQ
eukprot:CAMPEP_0184480856 /NCGR_PEP_ID=MMETSP0113_2-20130426/2356_1 /TAXON_ID=91329 /ORGANISM="Norrisiella sphaerica, Strain BC52" /LENGTH=1493 /DNA_ID=CAMNT_0026859613 /DNA_START=177 /DNA_END=4658 /DNA_ORIENTATION=+